MADTLIKKLQIGDGIYTFNATQFNGHESSYYATAEELRAHLQAVTGALVYKGSLLSSSSTTGYTPAGEKGHVYVTSVAGTVNGVKCESGDMWICHTACAAATSANAATIQKNWDVIQANIDVAAFAKSKHIHSVTATGTVGSKSITPEGTISQPTFTGEPEAHKHTVTSHSAHTFTGSGVELVGTFTGKSANVSGSYTPEGTNGSASITPAGNVTVTTAVPGADQTPDFYSATGTTDAAGKHTHTGKVSIPYTPAGNIEISKATSGTTNYTPAGSLDTTGAHTHEVDVSIDYAPAGSISGGAHTHTVSASGDFTPTGSITVPASGGVGHTHAITPTTSSISYVKSVSGNLTGTYNENTQTLSLSHTITAPTANFSAVTAVTTTGSTNLGFNGIKGTVSVSGSAASATPADLVFTGTKTTLTQAATAKSAGAHTHKFTGTGARLTAAFTGTATTLSDDFTTSEVANHTHGFTGTGKMFSATFAGTAAEHTHTFNGKSKAIGGTVTAAGSVKISVGTGPANYTPSGTITTTAAELSTSNVSVTPKGTVSKPTFTGTAFTHDHTFTGTAVNSSTEK